MQITVCRLRNLRKTLLLLLREVGRWGNPPFYPAHPPPSPGLCVRGSGPSATTKLGAAGAATRGAGDRVAVFTDATAIPPAPPSRGRGWKPRCRTGKQSRPPAGPCSGSCPPPPDGCSRGPADPVRPQPAAKPSRAAPRRRRARGAWAAVSPREAALPLSEPSCSARSEEALPRSEAGPRPLLPPEAEAGPSPQERPTRGPPLARTAGHLPPGGGAGSLAHPFPFPFRPEGAVAVAGAGAAVTAGRRRGAAPFPSPAPPPLPGLRERLTGGWSRAGRKAPLCDLNDRQNVRQALWRQGGSGAASSSSPGQQLRQRCLLPAPARSRPPARLSPPLLCPPAAAELLGGAARGRRGSPRRTRRLDELLAPALPRPRRQQLQVRGSEQSRGRRWLQWRPTWTEK